MTLNIKNPALIILGAQGAGKSTVGNLLLEHFETNDSLKFSISDGIEENTQNNFRTGEITIEGKEYSVVDTIGIPEYTSSNDIWNKLKKVRKEALDKSGIKAYIFVLEGGRITQHGLLFINRLFSEFPNSRTIVVFTKVRKSLISNEEMRKTFGKEMSTHLQKINDRWIVMPSLDLFDGSEGKNVIEGKVAELKNRIEEIGKEELTRPNRQQLRQYYLRIGAGVVFTVLVAVVFWKIFKH